MIAYKTPKKLKFKQINKYSLVVPWKCIPSCLSLEAPQQEWIHQVLDKPSCKNKQQVVVARDKKKIMISDNSPHIQEQIHLNLNFRETDNTNDISSSHFSMIRYLYILQQE